MKKSVSFLSLLCVALGSCDQREEIRVYSVPKERRPADAILGAVLPQPTLVWFFKAKGPAREVEAIRGGFLSLLKSARFDGEKIVLQPPPGWTSKGSASLVAESYSVSVAPGTEVTVTPLPPSGAQLSPNVNRWRGQLGLAPISAADLSARVEELSLPAGKASLILIKTEEAPTPPRALLRYTAPEGWRELPPTSMRAVGFEVREAQVTVIPLGLEADRLLDNINRWRDQIGLKPIESRDLSSAGREIEVAGNKGRYVDLRGTDGRRILAVQVRRGDRVWFFKMTGPDALLGTEKTRFEAFLRSVAFLG